MSTDEIMALADAYADSSFDQGLNRVTDTPEPENARAALLKAVDKLKAENENLKRNNSELADQRFVLMEQVGVLSAENERLRAAATAGLTALTGLFSSSYGDGGVVVWRLGGSHEPRDAISQLRAALGAP